MLLAKILYTSRTPVIKISASATALCDVSTKSGTFAVFPKKPRSGVRSIMSHPEENFQKEIVSWPGEYDFGGIFFRGIGQKDGSQVSYVAEAEGVRLAFIDAPILEWSDSDIEHLGTIDALIMVSDKSKNVQKLVEEVDPHCKAPQQCMYPIDIGPEGAIRMLLAQHFYL
jgi:hypothetical protein